MNKFFTFIIGGALGAIGGLLLAPRSALRNLRRLRDMGLEGRYGLYEAVDYTPARMTGEEDHEVVRSYMSHHLGMSLVAIDNVLRDNVMQRRFMRDCDMSAYRELLQERVPVGAPIMKQEERDFPARLRPGSGPALVREGEDWGRKYPRCHLLSNGSYSLLACDNVCPKQIPLQDQLGIMRRMATLESVKAIIPEFLRKKLMGCKSVKP